MCPQGQAQYMSARTPTVHVQHYRLYVQQIFSIQHEVHVRHIFNPWIEYVSYMYLLPTSKYSMRYMYDTYSIHGLNMCRTYTLCRICTLCRTSSKIHGLILPLIFVTIPLILLINYGVYVVFSPSESSKVLS